MPFALITGASKGIGKAIAQQLAAKGHPLLLIARSADLLQSLASELQQQYNIQVHYFAIDLAKEKAVDEVYTWCQQQQYVVDILVNNAGYGLSGAFEKYPIQEHLNMMQLNMNVVVELIYRFLPMLKQQSKAYIMNIASSAAYQAVPYLGLYAATKAFVLQFSRALSYELRNTPVSVTCVSPGATDTDFANRANIGPKALNAASKLNMRAEEVAAIAVNSMFSGKTEVITGLINKAGAFLAKLLPKKMLEKGIARVYE